MDAAATSRIELYVAIVGLISAIVGTAVGALITGLLQRKKIVSEADKDCADANEQIRQTVMSLIEPLNKKVDALEKELQDWKNWALALVKQIKELGHEPVPFKSHKDG